ncbi:MAG TPA: hypothetical protein VNM90_24970 [Haliangium sp.]|nr:hypothetical protein [Haliangium sp.]
MARDDRKAPPEAAPAGAGDPGDENAVETAIDALFQGPLDAFVSERNRLARDLRGRDREASERVHALAKPSVSAWAVNQAYWHARPQFSALLDAGEAVRALQQRVMRGEAVEGLAAASARLHEALAPVARAAQQALEQDGHSASPQLMRRVITTLQALAAHGRADTAPPAGRLSADVDAPGFDLLTALAPAHGPTPRRTVRPAAPAGSVSAAQDAAPRGAHRSARGAHRSAEAPRTRQEAQARHAARARVSAAKAALVARQRTLTSAERDERDAAERLDAAEAAVAAARAALDRATMARDRAAQTHQQAQTEAGEARAAFVAARDELESAENQERALARDRSADGHEPT